MTPQRIQRKRAKGWRQPPHTKYCGRGSQYGNDHIIGEVNHDTGKPLTRAEVVMRHKRDMQKFLAINPAYYDYLLQYDYLSCYCPLDVACHVDNIIEHLRTR